MKWIWIYFLCGQEVWSEPSMGARMVPANGHTTKTKKILYVVLVGKTFHLIYKYIHSRAIFVSRKGGRASIGYRASIGTYTVYIYWKVSIKRWIVTGATLWGRKCSLFLEHLISLPFGSSWFHPFIIYTLLNLSVLGLCLRINDWFVCLD